MQIACDEAGHTGPDLLAKDQRYFAFASVDISDDEAFKIIRSAREAHPVQMPELKASKLMTSTQGRKLVAHVIRSVNGRFAINAQDKLLALCGWIFEYVFEPVFKQNPLIFYQKDFHRFIAMYCFLWFQDERADAAEAIAQFQAYMRTKDISKAPILFDHKPEKSDRDPHPFELIQRFATGFKHVIAKDNAMLEQVAVDGGKWTLDLSASALWSHLNHWGSRGEPLTVICDDSKPLRALESLFSGDEVEAAMSRIKEILRDQPLGWELARPITFDDSRAHPSIQLADVLASTTAFGFSKGLPPEMKTEAQILDAGMLRDSIFPDFDLVRLDTGPVAVNYAVLYELALTAEGRGTGAPIDVYWGIAEEGVKQGKFKFKLDV